MDMRMLVGATAILLMGFVSACTSADTTASAPANSTGIANACINPTDISKQTIVSDQEIRFELRNGQVWVNHLPRACFSLKRQGGFTWDVHGTLVCSNEQTIYVREDGTPCQLGEFTRMVASAN